MIPLLWKAARPLRTYAGIMQTPKVLAAFVMMSVLAFLGYRRQEFFMSSGAHGKLWIGSGVVAALALGLTLVLYLPTTAADAKGVPGANRYLPLALVLAAMNSFAEEMLYRGVLLAPLLRQVTANQAISMTAVLFGIAHYHGTPSGFPGMGLTSRTRRSSSPALYKIDTYLARQASSG